jgi:Peptidase propeptide and YPEB domain
MWRLSVSQRVFALALAAGAGMGMGTLSACSSGGQQPTGTVPAAATALASTPAPASSGPVTADQASAIAVHASPGTVTEVDQEDESTGPVFDVKIQHPDGSETKVQVDANTGQVLSTETDGQDDQNDQPGDPQ